MKTKMKLKIDKKGEAIYYSAMFGWFTCPHCKKIVFLTEPKNFKVLKSWKKQK